MIEVLGPNTARTILGDAYNPDYRYELETSEDGFHIIITNPNDGSSSSMLLEPEAPDHDKLSPIWKKASVEPMSKGELLYRLLFWFCVAATAICVAYVIITQR